MRRVAYATGGHWFQHAILGREPYASALEPVYLPELEPGGLEGFDAVIVGSRGDADVLAAKGSLLLDFWRAGGHLVAFDRPPIDWLPAGYEWRETNFWWWTLPEGDLPLAMPGLDDPVLAGIEPDALKWHYHGVYRPPGGARTLVAAPDGPAVLYVERRAGSGTLVATTMDPDYHAGQRFIPKAAGLLEHLVGWAASSQR